MALDSWPGDFCREVVIVRARFGFALVAQLDRASDFESEGREFESLRARQNLLYNQGIKGKVAADLGPAFVYR